MKTTVERNNGRAAVYATKPDLNVRDQMHQVAETYINVKSAQEFRGLRNSGRWTIEQSGLFATLASMGREPARNFAFRVLTW